MDLLFNNPLANMYGPTFLLFYGSMIVFTLIGCWIGLRLLDHTGSLPVPLIPSKPDPYKIAYLRGGENEVTRLIIFDLLQRGYLQRTADDNRLERAPAPPDIGQLTRLERQVFDGFTSPADAGWLLM